jgi:hypothetical protein
MISHQNHLMDGVPHAHGGMVLVFRQKFALDDAIGSHA